MILETNEPIEVSVESDQIEGLIVEIDGKGYATLSHIELNELDEDKLTSWVENTYYDHDFDYGDVNLLDGSSFKKSE